MSTDTAGRVAVPARAWAVLAVTYLASFAAPLAQFKVPALANWIIPELIVPVTTDPALINTYFGLLMTALTIIGVILAFPASFIVRKIGLKATMLTSVAVIFIGTVISLLGSLPVVYVGRMVEGLGIGLIGVAAPSCVSIWFPPHRRGTALGIWATWVPLAITVVYNISPAMAGAWGWRSVYYLCLAFDVVVFIAFAMVFKMPSGEMALSHEEGKFKDGWKYLKNPKLWILAVIFFCFNVVQLGVVNTYYNQFLTSAGFSDQLANTMTTIPTVTGIFTAIIAGLIFDKLPGRRKHLIWVVAFACQAFGYFFAFWNGAHATALIWFSVLFTGLFNGVTAGTLRSLAPALVPRTALATTMAMSLMQFIQNFAPAIGSPIFGYVVGVAGWQVAGYSIVFSLLVLGCIMSAVLGSAPVNRRQEAVNARFEAEISSDGAQQ